MGGNDTITGNGNTRIAFYNATGGVTVDHCSARHGDRRHLGRQRHLHRRQRGPGSNFDDTLVGSNNAPAPPSCSTAAPATTPSTAAAASTGRVYNDDADGDCRHQRQHGGRHGDRRRVRSAPTRCASIESVRGTNFADTYRCDRLTASARAPTSARIGTFNEFEGLGGNDTITGNGNTRISYVNATAGVTVTSESAGTATGNASVGTDTFSAASRASAAPTSTTRSRATRQQHPRRPGRQRHADGGGGADHFVYAAVNSGLDHIVDFSGHGGQNDVLDFDHLAFGNGLAAGGADTGTLDASHFVANATGATNAQQVILAEHQQFHALLRRGWIRQRRRRRCCGVRQSLCPQQHGTSTSI